MDFGMKDMLSSLRPKVKPYQHLQEAADAVENLEKELMSKVSQAVSCLAPQVPSDLNMFNNIL